MQLLSKVTSLQPTKRLLSTKWSGTARLTNYMCESLGERTAGRGTEGCHGADNPSWANQGQTRPWVQRCGSRGCVCCGTPTHRQCPNHQHKDWKTASARLPTGSAWHPCPDPTETKDQRPLWDSRSPQNPTTGNDGMSDGWWRFLPPSSPLQKHRHHGSKLLKCIKR